MTDRSIDIVICCGEVQEELFRVVRIEQGLQVYFNIKAHRAEVFLSGTPVRTTPFPVYKLYQATFTCMIRSLTSKLPRATGGRARYEATEIRPRSIITYVVASDVRWLRRSSDECIALAAWVKMQVQVDVR